MGNIPSTELARPGFSPAQVRKMIAMLVAPSTVSVAMLLARFIYVGDTRLRFCGLLLNLALAWTPMLLSIAIWRTSPVRRLTLAGLSGTWLLFFPNAFYITTDLIHTQKFGTDGVHRWYDILMTGCFAATGLFLGSFALLLLHVQVRARRGAVAGWLFSATVLALGSFGIYLGRFVRLNSWDVITQPATTAVKVLSAALGGLEVVTFCGAFFVLSVLVYSFVFSTAQLHTPSRIRS